MVSRGPMATGTSTESLQRVRSGLSRAARWARPHLLQALRAPTPAVGMEVALSGLAARGCNPGSVLDVGAAAGSWTEMALRHWPAARYLMIEPLEERRAQLASLARAHPAVEYIGAAAGRAPGELTLNVASDLDGSSVLYEGVAARTVPVVTVDSLIEEGVLRGPDLMKLDVQGYELDVLAGAEKAMCACEAILMEVRLFRGRPGMPTLREALNWMAQREFALYEIADVLRRPLDGAMAQCDLLFLRAGSALLAVEGWA